MKMRLILIISFMPIFMQAAQGPQQGGAQIPVRENLNSIAELNAYLQANNLQLQDVINHQDQWGRTLASLVLYNGHNRFMILPGDADRFRLFAYLIEQGADLTVLAVQRNLVGYCATIARSPRPRELAERIIRIEEQFQPQLEDIQLHMDQELAAAIAEHNGPAHVAAQQNPQPGVIPGGNQNPQNAGAPGANTNQPNPGNTPVKNGWTIPQILGIAGLSIAVLYGLTEWGQKKNQEPAKNKSLPQTS